MLCIDLGFVLLKCHMQDFWAESDAGETAYGNPNIS